MRHVLLASSHASKVFAFHEETTAIIDFDCIFSLPKFPNAIMVISRLLENQPKATTFVAWCGIKRSLRVMGRNTAC